MRRPALRAVGHVLLEAVLRAVAPCLAVREQHGGAAMHRRIDEAMRMRAGAAGLAHPRGEAVGPALRGRVIRHQLCTFGVSGREAHSVQDPSYNAGSAKPARSSPRARMQAVTPVPQEVTTGRSAVTPAAAKSACSACGSFMVW